MVSGANGLKRGMENGLTSGWSFNRVSIIPSEGGEFPWYPKKEKMKKQETGKEGRTSL